MIRWAACVVVALATAALVVPGTAAAYDPRKTFVEGTVVVSPEFGYGHQFDLEGKPGYTGLDFVNVGVRFGLLPFGPTGSGPMFGAFEVGLEPLYQQYLSPKSAFFAGLGATFKYHFLALDRLVPYVELAAFAGGTNLEIREIRSDFAFLLYGGLGLAYFVADRTSVYAGYRYQHVSNGNTESPNRGFEANWGVVGMSFFFD
jgi:opacity protein-like surface antigen